jgi:D-amino-acid oxidase
MGTAAGFDALVIGAGVSGLTTAVCLAEAGWTVGVVAERPPAQTTSAVAGASWGPYMVSDPRVLGWSERTRAVLEEIAEDPASGVRLTAGLEAAPVVAEPPSWATAVHDFRRCQAQDLPGGYLTGWRYTLPLVDMPRYLEYLVRRLRSAGGDLNFGIHVSSFGEVGGRAGLVVNCSGLGSRTLVPDGGLYPIRGQLVVVENPGIQEFFQDDVEDEEPTYILPHGDNVVLGGSAIVGSEEMRPDPATAEAILARCAAVEPRLKGARVVAHRVGLRPTRAEVRVQYADEAGVPVIHNYGHGGAGLTLSWGCAEEALGLAGSCGTAGQLRSG